MRLDLCSWPRVRSYLDREDRILVPIGSTEQHGPTGLCGTDTLAAGHIAEEAAERTGLMAAPPIAYGMSHHHMAFPGTVSLGPGTLQAVIRDVVRSLHRHGFRRILFVNGHGGNTPSLECALAELGEELPDASLRHVSWWKLPGVDGLEQEIFGERCGSHASPSEISVTQVFYDGHVEPCPPVEPEHPEHPWPLSSRRFREIFPDGRMESDPSLATAAHGRRIFEKAVAALVELVAAL